MLFELIDVTTETVVLESRYRDLLIHAKSVQFFPSNFTISRKES